jgi:tetratricopeptide (TPR) repeat protein
LDSPALDGVGQPPDPTTAATPGELVERLRELRLWAGGPSLRRLRQLAGTTVDTTGVVIDALPVSTASRMLRGDRLPRMEFVRAFVTACLRARRRDPAAIAEQLERWHEAWLRLQPSHREPAPPATAVTRPAAVPRQLPADTVGFTGRVDELATLTKALAGTDDPGPAPVAVISGLGGVGKSALAIHVAHELADRFPDGQLYVDLHGATAGLTPLVPLEVLSRFLRALGIAGSEVPDQLDEAAARFRTVVAGRRLLLVLDSAADAGQVRPLLPGTPGCRVLVTSRQPLSGLDGARHLPLDVLPEADAVCVLARMVGAERVAAEPEASAEVARQCGCLPLALRIAAARLAARPVWPVATLAQRLADSGRRLDELQMAEAGVRTSLGVSYRQLRDSDDPTDQDAARAFGLLGIWDGPDVALPVAARLLDRPDGAAEPLLERLVDAQLLQTRSAGRYQFHDLLRLYARELAVQAFPEPERIAALERALRFYTATAWHTLSLLRPGDHRLTSVDPHWADGALPLADPAGALTWLQEERPNLLSAAAQAAATSELAEDGGGDELGVAAIQLAQSLFGFFRGRSYWRDWEQVNEIALRVARHRGDDAAAAQADNDVGAIHFVRGRYDRALKHFQRSIAVYQRLGDRNRQATTLNNLGMTFTRLGMPDQAQDCLRQALALHRALGGRRGEASTLHSLGLLLATIDRRDEALLMLQQSLAIFQELGSLHDCAMSLNGLGDVYHDTGRNDEALTCLQQSLEINRKLDNRYGQAADLDLLGTVYHAQHRYRDALTCFELSLSICRELGIRQIEAVTLRNLGVTLNACGRTGEAHDRWTEALVISEELGLPADELRSLLTG